MMGTISRRAGAVPRAIGSFTFWLPGITSAPTLSTLPNLPPQQPLDHQIQISGKIRLARTPGCRVRTQHKKATARKQLEIATH